LDGPGGKDWSNLGKTVFSKAFSCKFDFLDGMMKQMGGGGASPTDLTNLDDEDADSDDEPMPDLEDVPKSSN
jgi:hypothetical protein